MDELERVYTMCSEIRMCAVIAGVLSGVSPLERGTVAGTLSAHEPDGRVCAVLQEYAAVPAYHIVIPARPCHCFVQWRRTLVVSGVCVGADLKQRTHELWVVP